MLDGSTSALDAVFRQINEATDRVDAALAYARAGCSVLFIDPTTKAPLEPRPAATITRDRKAAQAAALEAGDPHWQDVEAPAGRNLATDKEPVLKRYAKALADRGIVPNVGIHVGWSGLVLVDVDTPDERVAVQEMAVAGTSMPPEAYALTTSSPGQKNAAGEWVHWDGGHFVYVNDVPGLEAAAEFKLPGGGVVSMTDRYFLAPPSTRPEGTYRNAGPLRPLSSAPWLVERIRQAAAGQAAHQVERAQAASEREERAARGEEFSDLIAWNDAHSWDELLTEAGWEPNFQGRRGRLMNQRRDKCQCPTWTAPGDHADGKSATAHDPLVHHMSGADRVDAEGGSMPLHVWTSSRPAGLEDLGRSRWTKAQFVTATRYGGDFAAFLAGEGIAAETAPEPWDTDSALLPFAQGPGWRALLEESGFSLPDAVAADAAGHPPVAEPVGPNPFADHPAAGTAPEPEKSQDDERGGAVGPNPEPATGDLTADEETAFWESSDELKRIRQFAWSRLDSAWSTLGAVLCHVAARIPHTVVLPPLTGGVASLNTFVAVVGASGTGKGNSAAVARDLIRGVAHVDTAEVGSGEGLPKTYGERKGNELKTRRVRDRAMFEAAEVDTIVGQGGRQGSTLLPQLRKLWSGESLGFRNSDKAKNLDVPRHSYRATLTMGVQPLKAGPILRGDADGGLPQRFVWLPTLDPTIPDPDTDPVTQPEPLDLSHITERWPVDPLLVPLTTSKVKSEQQEGIDGRGDDEDEEDVRAVVYMAEPDSHELTVLDVAEPITAELRRQRYLKHIGQAADATLDGHAGLARLKVAAVLGVLEGGDGTVTEDLWERAGLIMRKSTATREAVARALAEKDRAAVSARVADEVTVRTASEDAADAKRFARIGNAILRKLGTAGSDGMGAAELRNKLAARDRADFAYIMDRLVEANRVRAEEVAGTSRTGLRYWAT